MLLVVSDYVVRILFVEAALTPVDGGTIGVACFLSFLLRAFKTYIDFHR